MKITEIDIRQWTLRVSQDNDGSGYIYSGDDIFYPEDDYIEVVELKPVSKIIKLLNEEIKELKEQLKNEKY